MKWFNSKFFQAFGKGFSGILSLDGEEIGESIFGSINDGDLSGGLVIKINFNTDQAICNANKFGFINTQFIMKSGINTIELIV